MRAPVASSGEDPDSVLAWGKVELPSCTFKGEFVARCAVVDAKPFCVRVTALDANGRAVECPGQAEGNGRQSWIGQVAVMKKPIGLGDAHALEDRCVARLGPGISRHAGC